MLSADPQPQDLSPVQLAEITPSGPTPNCQVRISIAWLTWLFTKSGASLPFHTLASSRGGHPTWLPLTPWGSMLLLCQIRTQIEICDLHEQDNRAYEAPPLPRSYRLHSRPVSSTYC